MSDNFHNPYQAPDPDVARPLFVTPGADSGVNCVPIYSNLQHRILALRGAINAVVEWNAMGFKEFIAIDGQRIASRPNFLLRELWEFELQSGSETYQAAIELNAIWRSFLRGVRLRIDGEIVYSDGKWPS